MGTPRNRRWWRSRVTRGGTLSERFRRPRGNPPGGAIILTLLLTAMPVVAGAQTATPSQPRDAPPPTERHAEPRSFAELNRLAGLPVLPAERSVDVIPQGSPASAETTAEITRTVRELVACYNAGALFRAYGLSTDSHLRRLFGRQGAFTRPDYDALATPRPAAPPERAAILSIRDVRLLPADTVGATVTIEYDVVPLPKTFFFAFVRVGDRWLIDDIIGEISFSVP